MSLNGSKTKIVIFRNSTAIASNRLYKCGDMNIEYAEEYKYLGLYLNSQLDWSKTVKILSQSAA
jgi:hypothetical protein